MVHNTHVCTNTIGSCIVRLQNIYINYLRNLEPNLFA